ncbi:MAG TPA: Clp protease N-terminal domain-containing protein [Streptosporangiaceae bacterium]|jgi:hypothetical protein
MFERFTDDARVVVRRAEHCACQLGHRYVGPGHLLLAVAAADAPAGEVLREQGITPELVKEQIVRRAGLGDGAGLFAGLDEKALAAIGIDLDAVQATIEASFSDEALYRAAQSLHAQQRRPRNPRPRGILGARPRGGPGVRPRAKFGLRLPGRRAVNQPASVDATGRYVPPDRRRLPFDPGSNHVFWRSLQEALALHDTHVDVQHIALAILGTDGGGVPPILAALHAHTGSLRTAILNRYRRAS